MAPGALSHLRVIDLTHYIAGPYCTKLMAGFGADVIKVERPETGDKMRNIGPFFKGKSGLERSIPFLWLNTGKKSITLDLKKEKGVKIVKRLVQDADVLVENFSPRVMSSLGLNYETLREINPRLVMTSISNFGQTGPYKDFKADEIIEYALSGGMYLTGEASKEPLNSRPTVCQYTAGVQAYIASLAVLFQRKETGQHIDVSIHESAIGNLEITLANYLQERKSIPKRNGDQHPMVPWELYECADGQIALIGGPIRHWLRAAELFSEPALLEDKFRHPADRISRREEFEAVLKPCVKRFKKKQLFHAAQSRKLAFGYLADLKEAFASPQHRERQFFQKIDHPVVGKHKYCGAPFKMSRSPWESARAPLLGEYNQAVYGGLLGYSQRDIEQLQEQGVI